MKNIDNCFAIVKTNPVPKIALVSNSEASQNQYPYTKLKYSSCAMSPEDISLTPEERLAAGVYLAKQKPHLLPR